MKNKKLLISLLATATLGACTTPTGNAPSSHIQTPEQIAAQVCPPLQAALSGLNALAGLPPQAKADLDVATPIVAGVCAAGATINLSNLQSLQQTAMPTIINVVKASGMAIEQQNSLILDITAAQLILNAIVQSQMAVAK